MKYYRKYPLAGLIILPPLGSILAGTIVLPICNAIFNIDGGSYYELTNAGILLFLYVLFLLWFVYANRFKDYIELSPGIIVWGFDKREKEQDVCVNTRDILLLEIVSMTDPPSDEYFIVHLKNQEPRQFNAFDVPVEDVLHFCNRNNIETLAVIRTHTDIGTVKIGREKIVINYAESRWYERGKRIHYSQIAGIDLVSTHPVSDTRNYYAVHTKSGEVYEFSFYFVKRDAIDLFARKHGFSITERKQYY